MYYYILENIQNNPNLCVSKNNLEQYIKDILFIPGGIYLRVLSIQSIHISTNNTSFLLTNENIDRSNEYMSGGLGEEIDYGYMQ